MFELRRTLVWVGTTALLTGTLGVLNAPAASAAAASVGNTTVSAIGASTATVTATVNPNGTDTTVSALCQGLQPFAAASQTLTAAGGSKTVSIALTGLTGFGKYVCSVTAKQAGQTLVVGQVRPAFFTTTAPPPVTLYVDGNPAPLGGGGVTTGCTGPGPQACQTIQQAVSAAQALSDSTVTIQVKSLTAVGPGAAYFEAVSIALPETVRLRIAGVGNPIVRGLLGKSVFTITGPTGLAGSSPRVTLVGMTISGGEALGNGGGGVTVAGDLVWLSNNVITDNRGNTGAGVYNNSTNQLTLINNTITANLGGTNSANGVAVFTLQGSTLLMNNTLADNPPTGTGTGLDQGVQGSYRLINSILSRTTCGNYKAGTVDGGHNAESGNTCGLNATTNRVSDNAIGLASALAANDSSGPMTLAIATNSSAHNLVPIADCAVTFDGRGFGRPGFDGQNCDAGAFEIQAASSAPSIGATTASAVTDTAATLTAQVNPGGAPTSVGVTCTGGPYNWSSANAGSGRSPAAVSANLSGLTPGTEYVCALKATSTAGEATSTPAATFTTAATPPAPTPMPTSTPVPTPTPVVTPTPSPVVTPTPIPVVTPDPTAAGSASRPTVGATTVSGIGTNTATLSAPINPNNASTSATATCTGGAWSAGGAFVGSGTTPVTISVPLTGLSPGTIYSCAILATNSAGTTASATPAAFSTAGAAKASLTVQAKVIKAKQGKKASYTVATFKDPADLGAKSYTVTIAWGDGTTSKGTVTRTGTGSYKVTGKHTYKTAGSKSPKVTVGKAGTAAVSARAKQG